MIEWVSRLKGVNGGYFGRGMIIGNFVTRSLVVFGLLLCVAVNISASEKETACPPAAAKMAEHYRQAILSGDPEELARSINFPIKALIGGSKVKIRGDRVLKYGWKYIFSKKRMTLIGSLDACGLARELNLDPVSLKIQSLVILYDKEDSEFGYSGIESKKDLTHFINTVIELSAKKDYQQLAPLFRYPIVMWSNNQSVLINNQQEFMENADEIINEWFIDIVTKSFAENAYSQHPRGLMLNQRGDIWVYQINGDFVLIVLGNYGNGDK